MKTLSFNSKIRFYLNHCWSRFVMRLDQERTVLRYIVSEKPKSKTILVVVLRALLLVLTALVVTSYLLAAQFVDSPTLNVLILSITLWITARFLWIYGNTIKQVKRFSVWLVLIFIFILPLPFFFTLQATNGSLEQEITTKVESNRSSIRVASYSFNTIIGSGKSASKSKFKSRSNRVKLNMAKVSPLSLVYSAYIADEVIEDFSDVEASIVGKALAYPNPYKASEGTQIGYELSKPLDIEIHVYNMLGHLVAKKFIDEGDEAGGINGWNTVAFGKDDIQGVSFSAGAYFYLIINNGKVLGKGKMAVTP